MECRGYVPVFVRDVFLRIPRRNQMLLEVFSGGEIVLTFFAGLVPVKEGDPYRTIFAQFDGLLEEWTETFRVPIWSKAHDLIFVPVIRKAQVMGERLIEDAERMRKVDPSCDTDVTPLTDAPRRAGKVAKTIDRDNDRLFERRNMER